MISSVLAPLSASIACKHTGYTAFSTAFLWHSQSREHALGGEDLIVPGASLLILQVQNSDQALKLLVTACMLLTLFYEELKTSMAIASVVLIEWVWFECACVLLYAWHRPHARV